MNDYSEAVLQAILIVTDSLLTLLKYDKTVQGEIYGVVNVDTGEYKVRYNGNIFSAYAEDTTKTYKVGDSIYIKVPEGDFSNRKIITSLVTAESLSSVSLTALANSIIDISPSFDAIYEGEDWAYDASGLYGVIAGVEPGEDGSIATICAAPDTFAADGYHAIFQQYANNYEYIRIKASFLTQFHSLHSKGNYGLEIEFYAKNDTVVSYRLDLENFNGDPYSFSTYATQLVVLKAQKNYLLGLKSIKLFEEDFDYDELYKNGVPTGEKNTTVANIFVKDIDISYVDVLDLSDSTYYLTISAPRGTAFTDRITSLSLVGCLIYQGENIIDDSDCGFQWYERDLSVTVGSEGYSKTAGFSWKPIDGATTKTLALDISDVLNSLQYKLVVTYGNDATLTALTEVTNRQNSYDYSIQQVTSGSEIYLLLISDESLVGDWYISYPDSTYSSLLLTEKLSLIEISSYLQYSSVTFYCGVYDSNDNYLGVLEHTIVNSDNEDDVTISYEGEESFRYDSNGDVTIEDAEKERTLQVKLAWKEGYGTSYIVSWYMLDENNREQALPTSKLEAYDPDGSMMEQLWVDNYNILHYNIKLKYKVNYNNNTVIIKITTLTESVYSFEKEILFLKDGDQGTNGTTYICAIRPCDSTDGTKLSGFNPLRYNDGWIEDIDVRCYVYKDGEPINSNDDYSLSYKWTGNNVTVDGETRLTDASDQVTVRGTSTISADTGSVDLDFYVKVQVDINDGHSSVTIYASYPIDVLVGSTNASDIEIDDIPLYIKYNSSGETPSFYSNDINFYYQGTAYNDNITSLNTDVLEIEVDDGETYLKPVSSFVFENVKADESNIAVLNLAIPDSEDRVIHPIVMYLDTYGNEAINGWDGTSLELNEKGGYILAPLIGAGEKDGANRFTGVVMGKDSGQDLMIGLYGYEKGVNTFGFMKNGRAFIGPSGKGLIRFDGTENGSTISSSNYDTSNGAEGMCITLADGSIKTPSYSFDGEDLTFLFKLANDSSSYFKIVAATEDDDKSTIFYVNGKDSYYLQSKGFSSSEKIGTKIDLSNGKITSYNFNIRTPYFVLKSTSTDNEGNSGTGGYFKFDASGGGTFSVTVKDTNVINIRGSGNTGYIQSYDSGNSFKVNLASGKLSCTGATISGDITADTLYCNDGEIGGWIIGTTSDGDGYLSNGNGTILNGDGITTGYIIISNIGYIGDVPTNKGYSGLGISGLSGLSIILVTTGDIRSTGNDVYMDASHSAYVTGDHEVTITNNSGLIVINEEKGLSCSIPKDKQKGIYARFA